MSDGHTTCSGGNGIGNGNGNGPIALAVERALLLSAPQPAHAPALGSPGACTPPESLLDSFPLEPVEVPLSLSRKKNTLQGRERAQKPSSAAATHHQRNHKSSANSFAGALAAYGAGNGHTAGTGTGTGGCHSASAKWLRTAVAVYSSSSAASFAAIARMNTTIATTSSSRRFAATQPTTSSSLSADEVRRRAEEDIRALARQRKAAQAEAEAEARRQHEYAARVREEVLAQARQDAAQRRGSAGGSTTPANEVVFPPIDPAGSETHAMAAGGDDAAAQRADAAQRRALRDKLAKNHADALEKRAIAWRERMATARLAEQRATEMRRRVRKSARRAAAAAERAERAREEALIASATSLSKEVSKAQAKALAAYQPSYTQARHGSRAEAEALWRSGMNRWKSRRKIAADARIFACGGWEDMRAALVERGWVENKEYGSPFFHLRWASSRKELDHNGLQAPQAVNYHCGTHLGPRECLTTKVGLANLVRALHMTSSPGPSAAAFYPDCFDLSTDVQADEFRRHFRWNAASAILRIVAEDDFVYGSASGVPSRTACVALRVCAWRLRHMHYLRSDDEEHEAVVSAASLWTPSAEGAKALKKYNKEGGEEASAASPSPPDVTEADWSCLLDCPAFRERRVCAEFGGGNDDDDDDDDDDDHDHADDDYDDDAEIAAVVIQAAVRGYRTRRAIADNGGHPPSPRAWEKKRMSPPASPTVSRSSPRKPVGKSPNGKGTVVPVVPQQAATVTPAQEMDDPNAPSAAVVSGVARDVLAALLEADPQERIAGNRNVWIIKPACMSRGRGIGCYNNIDDLLRHANIQTKMSSTANAAAGGLAASRRTELLALEDGPRRGSVADKWVVQRYIERPLIVHRRKFDLRQWVVVSSWNPLKVWFYDKCYVRFAAEDYDGETGDIGNIFAHLTNNCIARHSLDFAAKDVTGEGNMWHSEQLASWLETCPAGARLKQRREGVDNVWSDFVQPAMKDAVKRTVQCAQEHMLSAARFNSHQLYGYDFMLDEDLGVWLIEVNTSPQLCHSTSVTARLCPEMARDLVKLMVDAPAHEMRERKAVKGDDNGEKIADSSMFDECDTGSWRCIYADPIRIAWPRPGGARPGVPLYVDGKPLRRKHRFSAAKSSPPPPFDTSTTIADNKTATS